MQQARCRSLIFDRWPRYASQRPWTVLLGVLLIIVTLFVVSSVAGGSHKDNFTIPGTDSQDAFDLISERFEGLGAGDVATVVIKADSDLEDPETRDAVAEIVEQFGALPGVAEGGVASPYDVPGSVSENGAIAKFDVSYLATAFEIDAEHIEALFELREEVSRDGLQVEPGGAVATVAGQEPRLPRRSSEY